MTFYVYILKCSDGSYYSGHTDNLEVRLAQQATGDIPGSTSRRRPVQLVWTDTFNSRQDAFERERQVKGWSRAKKEALVKEEWDRLVVLSRAHGSDKLTVRGSP